MTVRGLALDPTTNAPIVILKAEGGARLLPIWIGLFEANAIALVLEGVPTSRPMTHDLLKSAIDALDASVERVVVSDLRENTFYATVHLAAAGGARLLDARPSDAIALALRAGAPIFVARDVLRRARPIELEEEGLGDPEQWRQWLDHIRPDDFARGTPPGGAAGADDPERNDRADG